MSGKCAVIITTINRPTPAVEEIARNADRFNAEFILIGDEKSPADFHQENARYLDLAAQKATGLKYAQLAPTRHYARKNVGYLAAIRAGAEVIVETDDDNIPLPTFWEKRRRTVRAPLISAGPWCNVYRYFTNEFIWPRGLPLASIRDPVVAYDSLDVAEADCPIQQGLADGDPDVDAIYRLVLPLPIHFEAGKKIILEKGVWCPFNSQNTTWWPEAYPLLYLPAHCSWRMCDIWRSLIAQRLIWQCGWRVMFESPSVFQDRNEHDLMRDFAEEVSGYLNNELIRRMLIDLELPSGREHLPEAMRICYRRLVEMKLVGAAELPLLDAWLEDFHGA